MKLPTIFTALVLLAGITLAGVTRSTTVAYGEDLATVQAPLEAVEARIAPGSTLSLFFAAPNLEPGESYALLWDREFEVTCSVNGTPVAQFDVHAEGSRSGTSAGPVVIDGFWLDFVAPDGEFVRFEDPAIVEAFRGRRGGTVGLEWSLHSGGTQFTIPATTGVVAAQDPFEVLAEFRFEVR